MAKQLPASETEDVVAEANAVETVLSTRIIVRTVLLVLGILFAVGLVGILVYYLSGLILLIILAIFFAYLIAPLINLVQSPFAKDGKSFWMPRALAIGLVYLVLAGALYTAGALLLPLINNQISELAEQAPGYVKSASARLETYRVRYERLPLPKNVKEQIDKNITTFGETASEFTTTGIGTFILEAVSFLPWLVLIPILAFFFLKDAELFRLAAVRAFPRGVLRGRVEMFFQDVNQTLAAYTRAQLISCLLIGVVCTLAFYLIGVPYFFLLGLLAGVLEFIPLVGPLIVLIIATVVTGFSSGNQAIFVFVFLLILRLIHDYVTYPRILQQGIHLHPLAIILAIVGGEELAGITGIFLAIPVVALTTVTYRHFMEHSGSAGIVAELLDTGKTDAAVNVAAKQLSTIREEAKHDRKIEEQIQNLENQKADGQESESKNVVQPEVV